MTTASPEADNAMPLQIAVNAQYIKDFSFESPNAPHIFAPTDAVPAINMAVNVQTRPLAENTHEVALVLKLESRLEAKTVFIAELTYAGVFTVPAVPEEHLRAILLIEAPRLLFPFARGIVVNAVMDGGFPPVQIGMIDFASLYDSNARNRVMPATGTA